MKKPNIRVRLNGGSKTTLPQASTNTDKPSAEQGIHSNQTIPSWLKIEHLALLKVLANNRTKFCLNFYAIAALAREFLQVELKDKNQLGLLAMKELGWVEMPGRDHWRIAPAGVDFVAAVQSTFGGLR